MVLAAAIFSRMCSTFDVAGIAQEKAAIFDGLEPGGMAIVNADIETAVVLRAHAKALGFAKQEFGETATDWA